MKFIANLFWNQAESRLRTLWRIIIQFLIMGIFLSVFQAVAAGLSSILTSSPAASASFPESSGQAPLQSLISILSSGAAISASIFIAARYLDKRPFRDLGLNLSPAWWADFSFGFRLGLVLMLLIFITEISLSWVQIGGIFAATEGWLNFSLGLLLSALFFIAVGFYEELYNRGYLIKNLTEGFSNKLLQPRTAILLACLLTSTYFGLLHAANPNLTALAITNISLAGILFAVGYAITGQLGFSIGLHISWNFFQNAFFGFPVSGSQGVSEPVILIRQLGPPLWTGGDFGPEGGLLGSFALTLGLVLLLTRRNKKRNLNLNLSQYRRPATTPVHRRYIPVSGFAGMHQIKHIIWDWNGTLLDDLDLCLLIINNMLAARNLAQLSRKSYQHVFDFPVRSYYQKIGFDFNKESFESISDEFIRAYENGRSGCKLMEGAYDLLSYASNLGITQSILSASKATYLVNAVQEYGVDGYFNSVHGLDNHHAAGKLDLARDFMNACDLDPRELLLVGDTTHDSKIAGEIGVHCILIPNGHHSRDRLASTNYPVVNSIIDLKEIITPLPDRDNAQKTLTSS